MPDVRTVVHTDGAGLGALPPELCAEGPRQWRASVEARLRERQMNRPVPAEVQQELRRLLTQALVRDFLDYPDATKRVASTDGEHPPPDDNPKAGHR